MKVIVACPNGHRFRVEQLLLGKKTRCPHEGCAATFVLKAATTTATSAAAARGLRKPRPPTTCPYCGAVLAIGASFCGECRTDLATGARVSQELPQAPVQADHQTPSLVPESPAIDMDLLAGLASGEEFARVRDTSLAPHRTIDEELGEEARRALCDGFTQNGLRSRLSNELARTEHHFNLLKKSINQAQASARSERRQDAEAIRVAETIPFSLIGGVVYVLLLMFSLGMCGFWPTVIISFFVLTPLFYRGGSNDGQGAREAAAGHRKDALLTRARMTKEFYALKWRIRALRIIAGHNPWLAKAVYRFGTMPILLIVSCALLFPCWAISLHDPAMGLIAVFFLSSGGIIAWIRSLRPLQQALKEFPLFVASENPISTRLVRWAIYAGVFLFNSFLLYIIIIRVLHAENTVQFLVK